MCIYICKIQRFHNYIHTYVYLHLLFRNNLSKEIGYYLKSSELKKNKPTTNTPPTIKNPATNQTTEEVNLIEIIRKKFGCISSIFLISLLLMSFFLS